MTRQRPGGSGLQKLTKLALTSSGVRSRHARAERRHVFTGNGAQQSEGSQGPGGVSAVVAAGGCDGGVPGEFQGPHGEVPERGHDLGSVAGPGLGDVFAVGDIADVVQGFDVPVAAYPAGELGGGGLVGGQAGDGVDGDGPPFPAGKGPDPAGDAEACMACGKASPAAAAPAQD